METLQKVIQKGLVGAEHVHAFDSIQNQPPLRTLVGLLLAHGHSFTRARKSRKCLFEFFRDESKDSFGDVSFDVIEQIKDQQWKEWGVMTSVVQAIRQLKEPLKTKTIDQIVLDQNKNKYLKIGAWTRKAFMIMTSKDKNILLFEDSWIRKRWNELLHLLSFSIVQFPLTLETCQKLDITPTQLSRLLWRLSKEGVRSLVNERNTIEQAQSWFI